VIAKADPPKGWKICPQCGQPFQFWRQTAVYDTPVCRVNAARKRKRTTRQA
jgi:hypothetical protein